ncbi:MAG TPA: peptidoglycan editing factor PgeF [Steroidobacteraceae bacterium]|nr:peptidoglycan editing factor PgeF [Steroidobacteraceae bacterium]
MQRVAFITPDWPAPSTVRAASTLRSGGVSQRPFDDLNLAAHVGDDPKAIIDNRSILRAALNLPNEPCWLDQVHGDAVVDAGDWTQPKRADACIARNAKHVCAVLTADCLPVLFCNRDGDRVAAAHCGWRGLAAGILEKTIDALDVPTSDLIAWFGPAISQPAFEVGDDVRSAFLAHDLRNTDAFIANARGRWQCDLYELARRSLFRLGIHEIHGGGFCTFAERERFFSYRRDGQCGRMATLIWLA